MNQEKWLLGSALVVAAMALSLNAARAEDCPPGGGACKIVVITQSELKSLEAPGMIFDSAIWANRANLQGVVDAWKQKIANSPDGVVKPTEGNKPDTSKEHPKK